MHHAAIATRKGQQWHHAIRQRRAAKVGLEGEQVRGPRVRGGCERAAGAPRPAGRDHDPRVNLIGGVGPSQQECVLARVPRDRDHFGGLKQYRSGPDRGITQQPVQPFATQRPACAQPRIGQRGRHHGRARIGRDRVHGRSGPGKELGGYAAGRQYRHSCRRDEFTTHLAARKWSALDQRHGPTRLRQQPRRRRARRAAADHCRIKAHRPGPTADEPKIHG